MENTQNIDSNVSTLDISMLENDKKDDNDSSSYETDSESDWDKGEEPEKFQESELPSVTIITPTYNRKNTIKLSVINFLSFDYPQNKLEWIIIDDSDEPIKDVLPDDERIKYYYFDEESKGKLYRAYVDNIKKNRKKKKRNKSINDLHYKNGEFLNNRLPLGLKRNLAIAYSKNDYIFHMDDDDYYPKDSIKTRVTHFLENPKTLCLGCDQLNQFHTTKMASIKARTADDVRAASRIYESTLCYHRKFWDDQRFQSGDLSGESTAFLKNRSGMCEIIKPDNVIVGLIHKDNEKQYTDIEPNGWHFEQIPDELFLLITSF